jgi:hypothetical protein
MSHLVIELVRSLAWPVVLLAILVLFRDPLSRMLKQLGGRVSRISVWNISVELAVATPLPSPLTSRFSEVRASVPALIDSDARQDLLDLLAARPDADYVVVDLGTGDQWMTSRLFIFALLLDRGLGVPSMVFVRIQNGIGNLFSGLAETTAVWRRLEAEYGQALRQSRYDPTVFELVSLGRVHGLHQEYREKMLAGEEDRSLTENLLSEFSTLVPIFDLSEPDAGAQLLGNFLHHPWVSRPLEPDAQPEPGWIGFREQRRQERAEWIRDEAALRRILGPAWRRPAVVQEDEFGDAEIYRRALLKEGNFVAVVDSRERFIKLIDRMAVAEAAGRAAAQVRDDRSNGTR